MQASDVMKSPVVTVPLGTSLGEVANLFQQHGINGMPVVDADGRMVGIITEYDLIKKSRELRVVGLMDTAGWVSPHTKVEHIAKFVQGLCSVRDITVDEAMTRDVVSVREDASLEAVARLMVNRKINRVPVVRDNRVVGMITRTDLVWAMVNLCEINPGIF